MLQNLEFVADRDPELVLVLAGDHVYKMDYRPFLDRHRAVRADVTCAVRTVPIEEAHRFGIADVDAEGRITSFIEKPADPPSNLVSMGVYVFSWPALRDALTADRIDFGGDVLPAMVDGGKRVFAYEYGGYWQRRGHRRGVLAARTSTCSPTSRRSTSTTAAGSSTPGARSARRRSSRPPPRCRARW